MALININEKIKRLFDSFHSKSAHRKITQLKLNSFFILFRILYYSKKVWKLKVLSLKYRLNDFRG